MPLKKVTPDKPTDFEKAERKPYYPSFNLKLKDIPEAKKYSIGKVIRMEVEVEFTSLNAHKEDGSAGFDVKAFRVIKKNVKKDFAKMVKEQGGE